MSHCSYYHCPRCGQHALKVQVISPKKAISTSTVTRRVDPNASSQPTKGASEQGSVEESSE